MKPSHYAHVHTMLESYMRRRHAVHQWQRDQLKERTVAVRLIALYAAVAFGLFVGLWFTRVPPT
jgi:hypothetical protein